MKEKFFVALMIVVSCNFNLANAEQPAAETYREILQSETFYVEFKDKWGIRILANDKGVRMERMHYTFESGSMIWFNPLGAIFASSEDKNPEVMYKDGKFYNFVEKTKANVCEEKDLESENLDPRHGWNTIKRKLALPDALTVFAPNDIYNVKTSAVNTPVFHESFKKIFDGKNLDCDRYICEMKTLDGGEAAQLVYDILYKDGKIFMAETFISRGGKNYPLGILEDVDIRQHIPKSTFTIYKNTKLYAAGAGDIYDLLETPKLIGTAEDI